MNGVVAPDKILKELADLWVSTGKSGEGDGAQGVLRACTMTLVVMTDAAEDVSALGETIAALMPEHPARTILIRLSGEGERSLEQRVYAQCWMPFGQRRQICCEQVEIVCSDGALADLPSVVLPLAVADLPQILWCRSPRLLDRPEFHDIANMGHRIILNSSTFPDGRAALTRLVTAGEKGCLIGDLAWTQLTRWREMFSQIFENRQNLLRIGGAAAVRVECGKEASPVTAYYLAAWLQASLESAGVAPTVSVNHDAPGAATIGFVELESGDLRVRIERKEDRMVTTVNGLCQQMHLPVPSDYLLMREELSIVGRDTVFERALALAVRLAYATDK